MFSINAIAAIDHQADLHRAAEEWRRGHVSKWTVDPVPARTLPAHAVPAQAVPERAPTIALRLAQPDESYRVERLAALDDAPSLEGSVLLALRDGEAIAALSLQDGRVVANPFVPTADAVEILRARENHLLSARRAGARRVRRWRNLLRPRFA
jgi:hypothetical protein